MTSEKEHLIYINDESFPEQENKRQTKTSHSNSSSVSRLLLGPSWAIWASTRVRRSAGAASSTTFSSPLVKASLAEAMTSSMCNLSSSNASFVSFILAGKYGTGIPGRSTEAQSGVRRGWLTRDEFPNETLGYALEEDEEEIRVRLRGPGRSDTKTCS
jgi:hypothetical protein